MTKIADLPAQSVTRRSGLETDVQSIILLSQLLDRPLYRRRIILDLAEKPDLALATALCNRQRVFFLGYIKCNERFAIPSLGSSSVREDRLGPSEQPSSFIARKGGPPISASEHDVYSQIRMNSDETLPFSENSLPS